MLYGRTGLNSYEEIRSYSLRLAFQEAILLFPNRLPRLRGVPTGPASRLVPQTPPGPWAMSLPLAVEATSLPGQPQPLLCVCLSHTSSVFMFPKLNTGKSS